MIEMAGEMNVFVSPVRATNCRRRKSVGAGLMAGIDPRVKKNLFAARQACLQFPRFTE